MAPASVGETMPEVMVPMMMTGIIRAGQDLRKARPTAPKVKWPGSFSTPSFLAKK